MAGDAGADVEASCAVEEMETFNFRLAVDNILMDLRLLSLQMPHEAPRTRGTIDKPIFPRLLQIAFKLIKH